MAVGPDQRGQRALCDAERNFAQDEVWPVAGGDVLDGKGDAHPAASSINLPSRCEAPSPR